MSIFQGKNKNELTDEVNRNLKVLIFQLQRKLMIIK